MTGLEFYGPDGVHSIYDDPYVAPDVKKEMPRYMYGDGNTYSKKVPKKEETQNQDTNIDIPTNGESTGEEKSLYTDDYGNPTDNPNLITGKNLGEFLSEYLTPQELYEFILGLITKDGLLGKEYSDNYLCTNLGKDVINLLGENLTDYYPSDNLVKNNLDKLLETDNSVFELGKNDKVKSRVYVFYKIYNNDFNGHTGILYVDSNGNQTVLHNGRNPKTQFKGVSEYSRPNNNFNNFFDITEQKNNVYLKEIKKKR